MSLKKVRYKIELEIADYWIVFAKKIVEEFKRLDKEIPNE